MELVLIEANSPEWDFMWDWLAKHPINEGITEPTMATHEGESWQYMGSLKQKARVLHQFRHRCHPATNSVQNVSVACSEGFSPDQIKKEFKI